MKLYTKTGDNGETSLFDGTRVRNDHLRVATYGDVDELNAQIGVARVLAADRAAPAEMRDIVDHLRRIQSDLFTMGAELATPRADRQQSEAPFAADVIPRLERLIDEAVANVPALKTFVLPSGTLLAGHLHVCRTVCRRAERGVVRLADVEPISSCVIIYLNRLSDLFFAWARLANHSAKVEEEPWHAKA